MGRRDKPSPEPQVGLSGDRLALVHRYMVDAEEAEVAARAAAAGAKANRQQAAHDQARRVTELAQQRLERVRPEADELPTLRAEEPPTATPPTQAVVSPLVNEQAVERRRSTWAQETRDRGATAKDERRAAKEAARRIAALEKKEARERKALARAAAKRKGDGTLTRATFKQ